MVHADEVRAVLLDVDGTMYRQTPVRRAMTARLVRAHWRRPALGVRVTRVLGAYRRAQESLRRDGFEGDVIAAQLDYAVRRSRTQPSAVAALVDEWMETTPLDLVAASAREGLVAALDEMADNGLRLGVVSDYPAHRKLEALGIADRFDVVVSAQDDRVQSLKPNPRGILVALNALGVRPAEAVYVGDRPDVDAPAAAAAQVHFVLIGESRSRPERGVPQVRDFQDLVRLLDRG
jgi:HAD superfamily hydrolase (TIGR01549 family)